MFRRSIYKSLSGSAKMPIRCAALHHNRTDRKPAVSEAIVAYAYKGRYKIEAQRTVRERFVARR